MNAVDTLEILKIELPACFKRGKDKSPIAIGIHESVINHYARDSRFDAETLKKAIALYVKGSKYLSKITSGKSRIDLRGKPVALVTQDEQNYASKTLKSRKTKVQKKRKLAQS